jgi:Chaperonin 10 Kd subunit
LKFKRLFETSASRKQGGFVDLNFFIRGTGTPGDRVLFGKWSGTEVKIDGQELLIMKESDIMGIIDEPAAKKKAA